MARGGQWRRALALLEAMPQEMLETPGTGESHRVGRAGGPGDQVTVMTQERIVFDAMRLFTLDRLEMVAVSKAQFVHAFCCYQLLDSRRGFLPFSLPCTASISVALFYTSQP